MTSIVLAASERKRILRELLALPEPWSASTRSLYSQMIRAELDHVIADDAQLEAEIGAETFVKLVFQGVPLNQAREAAAELAKETIRDFKKSTSGRRERTRRKTFREAVTAFDGELAVTTGLVQACIVCGGRFKPYARSDAAYCSDGCRVAAYRKRKKAGDPTKAAKAARDVEYKARLKEVREAGLSDRDLKDAIQLAKLPDVEFQEFLAHIPGSSTRKSYSAFLREKAKHDANASAR